MEHLKKTNQVFNKVAQSQELKGIEKYGKPLNPYDNYDWLKMTLEEQVDGTKYLVAEMEKRKFICDKIRRLTGNEEVHFWLDELENKGE